MILPAETAEDATKSPREAWETETHKDLAQAVTDLHVLLSQLVQTHAAHKWVVPLTAAWIKIPTAEMLQLAELLEKDLGAETKTTAHRYSQDWVQEVFPKASLLAQMQVQYRKFARTKRCGARDKQGLPIKYRGRRPGGPAQHTHGYHRGAHRETESALSSTPKYGNLVRANSGTAQRSPTSSGGLPTRDPARTAHR